MNKAEKQRLINSVLENNPNCTECGKLINKYHFEYEPKFYPLDAPVVSKRADNGKKWVMCKECSNNQGVLFNQKIRAEALLLVDKNSIKQVSIKDMTVEEIKEFIIKQNLAINILLGQYNVPNNIIDEVKKTIRSEFHIKYYLKTGKFLTEK